MTFCVGPGQKPRRNVVVFCHCSYLKNSEDMYVVFAKISVLSIFIFINYLKLLQDLVPITEDICVPYDFHPYIIGKKGRDVRKMMEEYNVNISVPPQDDHSDYIKVRGPPANVRRAADALADKVKSLELEKEDRVITLYKSLHFKYHFVRRETHFLPIILINTHENMAQSSHD